MLASAPRGNHQDLLLFDVPGGAQALERPNTIYPRILAFRPHAGGERDPLRRVGSEIGRLRMSFTPTPVLRQCLHRLFAMYALVEVAAMCGVGTYILLQEHDIVYRQQPSVSCVCHGSRATSDRNLCDPAVCADINSTVLNSSTANGLDAGNTDADVQPVAASSQQPYEYLSAGLADGQALYVWAQFNLVINSVLYCLNCAVGKYPLGPTAQPSHRFSPRLRSLRGTVKLCSMLWYGAGCFVVWKAAPSASPPLFQLCAAMLLVTALVWTATCLVSAVARRCPETWLRLLLPLLQRGLLTLRIVRSIAAQNMLEAALEISFREEVERQQRNSRSRRNRRRAAALEDGHPWNSAADSGGNMECAICLEEYTAGSMVVSLPCDESHAFHHACIKRWVARDPVCPLCKTPLPLAARPSRTERWSSRLRLAGEEITGHTEAALEPQETRVLDGGRSTTPPRASTPTAMSEAPPWSSARNSEPEPETHSQFDDEDNLDDVGLEIDDIEMQSFPSGNQQQP